MPNWQKTPLSLTLPTFVNQQALDLIAQTGAPLPGKVTAVDGPIVTVEFNVTGVNLNPLAMPINGSEYVRLPVQVNDLGVAWPVPTYIGNVTGLGKDVPSQFGFNQGNLQLVWFPVGNSGWSASDDADALVLYGPHGVIIRDTGSDSVVTVKNDGTVTVKCSTQITLEISSTTKVKITSAGVFIDGQVTDFLAHTHSGVQTGAGTSGPVDSP